MKIKEKRNKLVSIIIAVYNEEKYISECIESILKQSYKNIEIIVIDGKSTDKTKTIVQKYTKKYPNKIILLENKEQKVAQGRNLGFSKAKGDYKSFIDGHSYADKLWVETLVKTIESQSKSVGAVGSVHFNAGKERFSIATTNAMSSIIGGGSSSYKPGKKVRKVLTTYACLYRTEVLEEIKNDKGEYYDPYFIKGQDAEMNLRINEKEYNILQQPEAITYYYKRPTIKGFWKQMLNAGFWRLKIIKKHPNSLKKSIGFFTPLAFYLGIIALFIIGKYIKFTRSIASIALGVYILAIIIVSIQNCIKEKKIYYLITGLLVFMIHIGYSLGLIKSLFMKTHNIKDRVWNVRN